MIEADAPILFTLAFLFVTMCFVILIVTLYRRKYFTKKSNVALFLIYWAFTTLAFFNLSTLCALLRMMARCRRKISHI